MKKQQLPQQNKAIKVKKAEKERLLQLTRYEQEAFSKGFGIIAGIDEAGRGPLAGPVVAAACIIPAGIYFPYINDSKQLAPAMRDFLYSEITCHPQVAFSLGIISQEEIDRVNIYQATILAMLQAVAGLALVPDYLLVDGLKLPHPTIPSLKIIKGDALSQSIAAASVLAKVTRDRLMLECDREWPHYGFKNHKGYATPEHLAALAKHGPSPFHRYSFEPVKSYVEKSLAFQMDLF